LAFDSAFAHNVAVSGIALAMALASDWLQPCASHERLSGGKQAVRLRTTRSDCFTAGGRALADAVNQRLANAGNLQGV